MGELGILALLGAVPPSLLFFVAYVLICHEPTGALAPEAPCMGRRDPKQPVSELRSMLLVDVLER